jgi:SAM-dependent methyltransferase
MSRVLRRLVARAIIIDRATREGRGVVGRVARERTEENYRFASRFVSGKTVLDIGGGTGIGHDLLMAAGAASILTLDREVKPTQPTRDERVRAVRGDFLTHSFAETQFDVILCLGTFFYLQDSAAALARMDTLLSPVGTLVINCINQHLIRRYFAMPLEAIDDKFSAAYDESGFRDLLRRQFRTDPSLYVQQPVSVSRTLAGTLGFWLIPFTWPWHRHPVMPRPPGTEGMYVYAVVTKTGQR